MENLHYLLAYVFVLLSLALSRAEGLGLEREIFLSSLRTLIQLILLGYLLQYLLKFNNLLEYLAVFSLMTLFASVIFAERVRSLRLFFGAYLSISLSYIVPVGLLLGMNVLKPHSYEVIPFGGLIIGNTLNSLSLFYDRIKAEIRNRKEEIEAKVALGATLLQALFDVIRDSIRMAMIPKLNWLKSAGVVHIPGVAVGMLVAGASPFKAILFQVVILYVLLFSGIFSASLLAFLGYKEIFRKAFQES
ncbi:ABC transporter permease [Aquifex sp.]